MRNFLLFISCVFLTFIVAGLNSKIYAQSKPFVVVLDAGHGGHDSGNRGNGYYEKKIALLVSANRRIEDFSSSKKLLSPFKRTLSRIYELTSKVSK